MSEPTAVSFSAVLKDVKGPNTHGGFLVRLDVPETEASAASDLLLKFRGVELSVAVVVAPQGK